MKLSLLMLMLSFQALGAGGIRGKVISPPACARKAMVWIGLDRASTKERLLLMHSEVPAGGSFQFNLKPGAYEVRGSDERDCAFLKKVRVFESMIDVTVSLEKK
jgi:hypothetical protein